MTKRFGDFEFDEARRRLTRSGQPIRLTGQALDLLWLLAERPGELVTREEIKRSLWPASSQDLDHSLDVLVNRLRGMLGDNGKSPQYIETVPRRGFRLVLPFGQRIFGPGHPGGQHLSASGAPRRLARRFIQYVAVALLAAAIGIFFARTRYNRFVPPQQSAAPAGSLTSSK